MTIIVLLDPHFSVKSRIIFCLFDQTHKLLSSHLAYLIAPLKFEITFLKPLPNFCIWLAYHLVIFKNRPRTHWSLGQYWLLPNWADRTVSNDHHGLILTLRTQGWLGTPTIFQDLCLRSSAVWIEKLYLNFKLLVISNFAHEDAIQLDFNLQKQTLRPQVLAFWFWSIFQIYFEPVAPSHWYPLLCLRYLNSKLWLEIRTLCLLNSIATLSTCKWIVRL